MEKFGKSAAIPNPALKQFEVLVGKWKTVGSHSAMPGVDLPGHASFEWIEGGAFMMMRSSSDDGKIPNAMAIFASDNTKGELFMLYSDEREVSRKCDVTFKGNVWTWFRSGPEFSQRYSFTLSNDGKTMIGKGEMSKDNGKTWEKDLEQTYTRV